MCVNIYTYTYNNASHVMWGYDIYTRHYSGYYLHPHSGGRSRHPGIARRAEVEPASELACDVSPAMGVFPVGPAVGAISVGPAMGAIPVCCPAVCRALRVSPSYLPLHLPSYLL